MHIYSILYFMFYLYLFLDLTSINLQDSLIYINVTGGSHLSHTAVKPDSHLA